MMKFKQIKRILDKTNGTSFAYDLVFADINGDKQKEIITVSPKYDNGAGKISIFSLENELIEEITPIDEEFNIDTIHILGSDIDQDGYDDLIISFTRKDLSGEVRIISGKTREILYKWKSRRDYDAFGYQIAVDDLNNDGKNEVIILAPQPIKNGYGKVYIYSTSNGKLIREYTAKEPREFSYFPTAVAIGDINGDGIKELLIGAPNKENGEVYIYNGINGWLLQKITGSSGFGYSLYCHDIDNDQKAEIFVTSYESGENEVSCLRSRPFTEIYTIPAEDLENGFGETLKVIENNEESFLIISSHDESRYKNIYAGEVRIFNAKDGKKINTLKGPAAQEQFGFSLAVLAQEKEKHLLIGAPAELNNEKGKFYHLIIDEA